MPNRTPRRILLAEDDPVSRALLAEMLRRRGGVVRALDGGDAACEAATQEGFDLLILDHRLPGMHGDAILRHLRTTGAAASRAAPALATTADPDSALAQSLLRAGFAALLHKPFDEAALDAALRACDVTFAATVMLDDATGIAASGGAQTLTALRGLFTEELTALDRDLEILRRDPAAFRERLHRLRAACGFCGANALGAAALSLHDALRQDDPARIDAAVAALTETLGATRAALSANPE